MTIPTPGKNIEQEAKTHSLTASTRRPYAWGFALMQGLLCLTLAIVLLEAFFYLAQVGDNEHCGTDLKLGYKPFAGKRITQRQEGFGSFKLNSFGMQNDEITVAKPADTYRIAVFGDSCVESLQVDRSKNYVSLLADKLSKTLNRPVQTMNFGVSNYSVAQDYLRYQTLAKQFKPDLVVQVYRVDEVCKLLPKASDSLLFVKPVFFPNPDGTLKYDDTCVRDYYKSKAGKYMLRYEWLRCHSRIWEILAGMRHSFTTEYDKLKTSALTSIPSFAPASVSTSASAVASAQSSASASSASTGAPVLMSSDQTRTDYTRCYWYMMDAQLVAFARECQSDGTKFMFLRTPSVRLEDHRLVKNFAETELLKQTAAKVNAPVLDLDQALRAKGDIADDGTNFSCKGHFTTRLHSWVADKLSNFVVQSKILSPASDH